MDSRLYTNILYELINIGVLKQDEVIIACLKYMSDKDVEGMMRANEFLIDEEDHNND